MTLAATLELTPAIRGATDHIFPKVQNVLTRPEWDLLAPYVDAINRLKRERDAVVLAHNYMTPDIYHGVADIVGDSLALAREAVRVDAKVLVVAGVHFMAETAKIVNPEKIVLIPDVDAGCSLAEAITAADIRALRMQHPGAPVVVYVNTTAEVKAEADICCTSGNAVRIVESPGRRPRSSSSPTAISPASSPSAPTSRSSPGRVLARSTSASPARTSSASAAAMTTSP